MKFHKPVLLQEVIEYLKLEKDDLIIDATIGGGGHAHQLLERGAKVLGIDRDQEAIDYVEKSLKTRVKSQGLVLAKGNFSQIEKIAKRKGFFKVKGVLLDLGLSSHQIEKAQRGFSFQLEGPLDMRMDKDLQIKASDIVNNFEERRLDEIIKTFGQEKFSRAIARSICSARQVAPIDSTKRLAQIISEVYAKYKQKSKLNPATRTFQALRIVVNSELLNLEESLPQTIKILDTGGRLVIISYHSLEDGIVKRFFKTERNLRVLTKKPIGPQIQEVIGNPRSRSAKLRAAEKI